MTNELENYSFVPQHANDPVDEYGRALVPGDPRYGQAAGIIASNIGPIQWGKNALEAFGKGLLATGRGEQDPGSALQVATMGTGAPGGLARPTSGRLGTFIGPSFEQIQAAKVLEENGLKGHEIWNRTGIWRGPEGEWRTEIPDHRMKLQNTTNPTKMSDLMDHPELYSVHPELANMQVKIDPNLEPRTAGFTEARDGGKHFFSFSPEAARSPETVVHEVQHYLQSQYGFARGGAPTQNYQSPFQDQLRPIWQKKSELETKQVMGTLTSEESNELAKYNHILKLNAAHTFQARQESIKNYKALAGEVEARNVADRYNTYGKLPPWYTQDIPYKDQIVTRKPMEVGPRVPDSFKSGGIYDPDR